LPSTPHQEKNKFNPISAGPQGTVPGFGKFVLNQSFSQKFYHGFQPEGKKSAFRVDFAG
jgi:hypothetical protein